MANKFPWWGWILVIAGIRGGALSIDWYGQFAWSMGSPAVKEGIEFVEGDSRRPQQPSLPVESE